MSHRAVLVLIAICLVAGACAAGSPSPNARAAVPALASDVDAEFERAARRIEADHSRCKDVCCCDGSVGMSCAHSARDAAFQPPSADVRVALRRVLRSERKPPIVPFVCHKQSPGECSRAEARGEAARATCAEALRKWFRSRHAAGTVR